MNSLRVGKALGHGSLFVQILILCFWPRSTTFLVLESGREDQMSVLFVQVESVLVAFETAVGLCAFHMLLVLMRYELHHAAESFSTRRTLCWTGCIKGKEVVWRVSALGAVAKIGQKSKDNVRPPLPRRL